MSHFKASRFRKDTPSNHVKVQLLNATIVTKYQNTTQQGNFRL